MEKHQQQKEFLTEILINTKKIESFEDELITIIPELIVCKNCEQNLPAHHLSVLNHIFEVVDGVRSDIILKLAALFHDIGKPYTKVTFNGVDNFCNHEKVSELLADLILKRLEFENDVQHAVKLLIRYHDFELSPTNDSLDAIAIKIGSKLVLPLLELQMSDLLAHSEQKVKQLISKRETTLKFYLENY